MKPTVHSLFPTPLFESHIEVQPKWLDFVKAMHYERTGTDNGYISTDRDIWRHPELIDLKHEISDAMKFFAHRFLKVSPYIYIDLCRGWAVKHMPGDWAQDHCHMNAVFSGVYYLDVTEDSGAFVVNKGQRYSNCFMPTLSPDVDFFNQYTQQSWRMTPKNGQIIAFPSEVVHNVEKNETDRERYVIGFDCFIRGTFGSYGGSDVTVK